MLEQPSASQHPSRGLPVANELPDLQGWEWKLYAPNTYECGTTAVTARKRLLEESESLPGEDRFAYVISGLAEYLLAHGVCEIAVPQYYSRFHDEFDPVIAEWTIERHGSALGIDANLLEWTVRLAEGKGRIDHDALSVYLCDNRTLVVTGSRGAFLVDVAPLKQRSLDQTPPPAERVDIHGFVVPEADPDHQRGLRRFIEIFDRHAEPTLTSYKHLSDGKHVFETDTGRDVYAGSQLRHLARMTVDETDLRGAYNYDLDGDTHQSVWDSETASHALGDETHLGTVVGFEHIWTEKEHIMSNTLFELQSKAKYWCFQPRPQRYSHFDFQVGSLDGKIDTFANGS
ncbi:hypothetical protein [Halococcus sp. PRR34]|uniref:hypothetical protein n=1 Tax=Halococcus sp. PRR34 TaxID=3020830 RepID=UPI002361F3CB|nr:hypothetical protein [Halococcus sp. PRR34]